MKEQFPPQEHRPQTKLDVTPSQYEKLRALQTVEIKTYAMETDFKAGDQFYVKCSEGSLPVEVVRVSELEDSNITETKDKRGNIYRAYEVTVKYQP